MKYTTFLKERISVFFIFLWLLFSIETFLLTVESPLWLFLFVVVNLTGVYFIITFMEFRRVKKRYEKLKEAVEGLEKKYLAPELLETTGTMEEAVLKEILQEMTKSVSEWVNSYRREMEEYKEYIELWIHEVKLPIAAAHMIAQNHKNQATEEMDTQVKRIENYTEQALFYARSNEVEKDYFIKDILLEKLVKSVLVEKRRELIMLRASLKLHDLNLTVKSDGKWLEFILGQILQNSMKYAKGEQLTLEIYGEENEENICLYIKDDGIGIKSTEITRVFDKGFTGDNGRTQKKATGLGLYLCKKLCGRLGHGINLYSTEGEGCSVVITFPKSSFVDVF